MALNGQRRRSVLYTVVLGPFPPHFLLFRESNLPSPEPLPCLVSQSETGGDKGCFLCILSIHHTLTCLSEKKKMKCSIFEIGEMPRRRVAGTYFCNIMGKKRKSRGLGAVARRIGRLKSFLCIYIYIYNYNKSVYICIFLGYRRSRSSIRSCSVSMREGPSPFPTASWQLLFVQVEIQTCTRALSKTLGLWGGKWHYVGCNFLEFLCFGKNGKFPNGDYIF